MAGNPDVIRVLHSELEYLDINIRTTQGPASTPLHLAAQRGKVEAVIALVDLGALIESVDRCWRTPLDVAIEYKQLQVVHVLKVYGEWEDGYTMNVDVFCFFMFSFVCILCILSFTCRLYLLTQLFSILIHRNDGCC